MAGEDLPRSSDQFLERVRAGGPPTADDVSITVDARRLDSNEAVMEWLAEIEAARATDLEVQED